jgi:hypothetical protein
VDAAAVTACYGSSAFATEFLAADGTRLGTGADTIDVSASAAPGRAWVRLVCYLPDDTGRRVIHGLCAFTVTGDAAPPAEGHGRSCHRRRGGAGAVGAGRARVAQRGLQPVLSRRAPIHA